MAAAIRVNGQSFTMAGALPANVPFAIRDVDIFVPLVPDLDPYRYVRNSTNFLRLFGRLRPGVDLRQAEAELTAICRSLKEQFPVEYARKYAVRAVDLREALIGDYRESMLLLFSAVLMVFGTGLANLTSLALVRTSERRSEWSVRVAMGASRPRILRQLMVESLFLALAGCGLGWVLANWLISAVLPWLPASIPRIAQASIDRSALGFAALIAVAATTILTVAPLGTVLRTEAGDALRLASRGAVGDRWSGRVRQALVTGEIAAALLLLVTTTALLQNIRRLHQPQLGFEPDSLFQARISIPEAYRSPDDLARFYDRLSAQLTGVPGVESIGLVSVAPLSGLLMTVPFAVEGEAGHERDRPSANLRVVSASYFETVENRLLKGRSLSETDRLDTPPVAVVSAALAKRFLQDAPLGRRLLINDNNAGPRPVQVVGVVEDVRQVALDAPPAFDVYIPLRQVHPDGAGLLRDNQFWMIRTATAPAVFRGSFLTCLRSVEPDAAVLSAGSMRGYIEAGFGPRRFNLAVFEAFSLAGILLAVVGMYGLVSYAVSQRTAEIGLRMAIGASESDIRRMILSEAARLGIAVSVLGGFLALLARPLLFRLAPNMPVPLLPAIALSLCLLALATLAAAMPARRAARIQPTAALKGE